MSHKNVLDVIKLLLLLDISTSKEIRKKGKKKWGFQLLKKNQEKEKEFKEKEFRKHLVTTKLKALPHFLLQVVFYHSI